MRQLAASGGARRNTQVAFAQAEMTRQQGDQGRIGLASMGGSMHGKLQGDAAGLLTQAEDAILRGFWSYAHGQRRAAAPETER